MNIDVLKDLSPAEPASAGDLPPFGLFAAGVYPFLEFRWFHEAYYRVLEAFAAGRVRRLIVTMPPQHGKSVGASTLLPAYLLGRNPDLRIAIASYSASLASKFNRRVQRIIDSPEYAAFFPETTIKRGARPPEYLRTADEVEIIGHRGGLLSVGREGALTGNRVDCFILDDLYREEELNVPYKALRECCINAFAHRVYHRPGSSVGIAIYDDRVEIENSGTFPPDITIEKLLGGHNSEPQNLIVANVLYKSAVLESWGRGIALMVNECRRVGIPDPEFHTDGNAVWIVFHYTRTTVGQDPTATPQQPYSNPTVTPQLGKLLSAIGNNTLSAKEIMEKTGMKDKRNFLKNYIHPAINSGLVLSLYPIGSKSPQQKYYLTDKGKGFLQQ